MDTSKIIDRLLKSDEPSIRWKVRVHVLGEEPGSHDIRALEEEVRRSPRVRALLAGRDGHGTLNIGRNIYEKWQGAHWVLAALADLGYPRGDMGLAPMRDQVLDFWLDDYYFQEFEAQKKSDAYKNAGVPVMQGRHRRCGSQQGNALYYLTELGLADEGVDLLVERLLHWQWPDGGWNCDKEPSADTSSFMETLLPMCGLAVHAGRTNDTMARDAALRASEVFLERRLYRRRSDGEVIAPEFIALHYPLYWHYDVLGGLKGMAIVGTLDDERCADALDLLESRRLPDGGWPAEKRYYTVAGTLKNGADYVDWGGTSSRRFNEWVTADALAVLRKGGRIAV